MEATLASLLMATSNTYKPSADATLCLHEGRKEDMVSRRSGAVGTFQSKWVLGSSIHQAEVKLSIKATKLIVSELFSTSAVDVLDYRLL